jgi:hypothetical protein
MRFYAGREATHSAPGRQSMTSWILLHKTADFSENTGKTGYFPVTGSCHARGVNRGSGRNRDQRKGIHVV